MYIWYCCRNKIWFNKQNQMISVNICKQKSPLITLFELQEHRMSQYWVLKINWDENNINIDLEILLGEMDFMMQFLSHLQFWRQQQYLLYMNWLGTFWKLASKKPKKVWVRNLWILNYLLPSILWMTYISIIRLCIVIHKGHKRRIHRECVRNSIGRMYGCTVLAKIQKSAI